MKKTIIFVVSIWLIFFIALMAHIEAHGYVYTPEEIVMIGKVVHHEAGNQSDLGKRLVTDTILNRVESCQFPDSVEKVLRQPGQYCDPKELPPKDIYYLIATEIYTRTNTQVLYYRTNKYHNYGTPLLKEGAHYFSGGD